jgi:tRNA 2-thiouridine synthesizing protein A
MGRDSPKPETPAYSIDVRDTRCPLTFVHVKVGLDAIKAGQVLEVVLSEGEQIQDVPRSLKEEGHRVLSVGRQGDAYRLLVRKGKK